MKPPIEDRKLTGAESKHLADAAAKAGLDFNDKSSHAETQKVTGEEADQIIHNMAEQFGEHSKEEIIAAGERMQGQRGLQESTCEILKAFAILTEQAKTEKKNHIESLRQYRMTVTTECDKIEKAVKAVKDLKLGAVLDDLERLAKALENPHIKRFIEGQSNG